MTPSRTSTLKCLALAASLAFALAACVNANPPPRKGMVKDPETGLQFGSVVERNFITDASLYKNRKIKIRTRNTSGDTAFDLGGFARQLRDAYAAKGYEPTDGDDFGLLLDVNVLYSGQMQTNLAREYSFLGAAGGGLAGAAATGGTVIGTVGSVLGGAVFGDILGSYVTDDTYIIVSEVSIGIIREKPGASKSISFSRSLKHRHEEDDEAEREKDRRSMLRVYRSGVSVFAGGRNTQQAHIAQQVRERIIRIVGDII